MVEAVVEAAVEAALAAAFPLIIFRDSSRGLEAGAGAAVVAGVVLPVVTGAGSRLMTGIGAAGADSVGSGAARRLLSVGVVLVDEESWARALTAGAGDGFSGSGAEEANKSKSQIALCLPGRWIYVPGFGVTLAKRVHNAFRNIRTFSTFFQALHTLISIMFLSHLSTHNKRNDRS